MSILLAGLVLFLGIHMLPMFGRSRLRVSRTLGEKGYRIAFSIISLIGLVLIVWGFARAPFEAVYTPFSWARPLAVAVLPVTFILLAAAHMPTHFRSTLKHPMLIGVLLWAILHLLNNGDLRSILLFGAFALWAAADMVSVVRRGRTLMGDEPPRWSMDLAAVAGGLVVYGLVLVFHGTLFGVPALPTS